MPARFSRAESNPAWARSLSFSTSIYFSLSLSRRPLLFYIHPSAAAGGVFFFILASCGFELKRTGEREPARAE